MRLFFAIAAAFIALTGESASAQDHSRIYDKAALSADAERYKLRVTQIYELGVEPFLTDAEKQRIGEVELVFPMPEEGDYVLDFYAYEENGRGVVALPVLSLKALEDLTTAYAWIYSNNYSLSTIDLYFAMLQHRPESGFAGGRYPPPLAALGVPADAYKFPPVDQLSLSLRNEAYAFALIHEIGHLFHDHPDFFDVSAEEAQADEVEADAFALEVLSRTGTPPLGPTLFFQAQAYSLPNQGQFETEAAWLKYLAERANHPITTDRLRAMGAYLRQTLADKRGDERDIWAFIGTRMDDIAEVLDDVDLQTCIATLAKKADLDLLTPRADVAGDAIAANCG
ncbi:MAG: hypothetical protein AAGF51_01925 [Pseudomonadota bacterium]